MQVALADLTPSVKGPFIGVLAGVAVGRATIHETAALMAGALLFDAITLDRPGKRSHRYVYGILAQAFPFIFAIGLSPDRNEIDLGKVFVASAVSCAVQIFYRELRHHPEILRSDSSFEERMVEPLTCAIE